MAVPPLPFKGNLYCPLQQTEEDVPIAFGDVAGGIDSHRETLRVLKGRTAAIAPFHVVVGEQTVPVTPLRNPITGLSSHHILRLFNSSSPNGRYRAVDCLFKDEDMYFVSFRRVLSLTDEEVQAGVQANGRWFRFKDKDINLPAFINATIIDMEIGYDNTDLIMPGGDHSIINMWFALAKFEDDQRLTEQVQRAIYNVMATYCEPRRLLSMETEMDDRIATNAAPAKLRHQLWQKIHHFGKFSHVVLDACQDGTIALDKRLPLHYMEVHGFDTMGRILGVNGDRGELLVVKIDITKLGLTDDQQKALLKPQGQGSCQVEEPGFQDQEVEGDGEDLENQ